ncbi:MAG: putative bifunctional diguanylate cyclase/phosphodiesterase [Acidimicrobiales bacterium]
MIPLQPAARPQSRSGAGVAALFALGAFAVVLSAAQGIGRLEQGVLVALAIATSLAMVIGLAANVPARRGPFALLVVAAALLLLMGLLRAASPARLGPQGSWWVEALEVGAGCVLALAASAFARSRLGRPAHLAALLEATIAGVVTFGLLRAYVVGGGLAHLGAGATARWALVAPASIDAYAIVLTVVAVARPLRNRAAALLVTSLGLLGAADGLHLWEQAHGPSLALSLSVALYALSACSMGASFLDSGMTSLLVPKALRSLDRPRSGLGPIMSVVAPGAMAVAGLAVQPSSSGARGAMEVTEILAVLLATGRVWMAAQRAEGRPGARLDVPPPLDRLSGAHDRAYVARAISGAVADTGRCAVLFVGLDRFKTVNDLYGYRVADQVLSEATRRLAQAFGSTGIVARVGGDEFAVVTPASTLSAAHSEAERARSALAEPFKVLDEPLRLSASVGATLGGAYSVASDEVLREADEAMRRAKGAGGDLVVVFDDWMREHIADRLALETELRSAVERGEFRLAFQPVVTLAVGGPQVVGLEALLRWERPSRGLVPASLFVGCAEAAGLLREIGDWALTEAMRSLSAWRSSPGGEELFVSVNVSSLHLRSASLPTTLARAFSETGVPPEAVCIELSESTLMDDPSQGVALVRQLKDLGVRLAVDDFGNGYVSLAYLRRFPVDYVKIDRAFVESLGSQDPTGETLVAAVVSMAAAVGASSIAEGVESAAQESVLRAIGCELAQGFYYARPVAPEDVLSTLRAIAPRRGLRLVTGDGRAGLPAD